MPCAFDRKGASIITFCRSVNCGMKLSSLPLGSAGMTLRNWETRFEGQLTKFALDGTYTIALEVDGDNCDLTNQSVSFSFLPSFLLSSYLSQSGMSDAWLSGMKKWRIPRPKMTSTGSQRSASAAAATASSSSSSSSSSNSGDTLTRRPADPPRDYLCDSMEQQEAATAGPADATETDGTDSNLS